MEFGHFIPYLLTDVGSISNTEWVCDAVVRPVSV